MTDRKKRVRFKLKKISKRNRISVFRSNNHIYAQVIDDSKGITISSFSSLDPKAKENKLNRKELAELVGSEIAKKTISQGINEVAFDKGKYKYHGLIKLLADAARKEGLNF